jgi:lipoprotein-anchoring transpeptidase ErfK/SrfK
VAAVLPSSLPKRGIEEMQIVKFAAILITGTVEAFSQESTRRLVVSIPDRKIALIEDGHVTRVYPVAVGKPSTPSPAGTFQIVSRIPHPTWYGHGQVVAPGPANPLGTRWIGLNERGYGIHGTNNQSSVGKAASHGCIRMRKADVEELFQLVAIGDTVELVETLPQDLVRVFRPAPIEAAVQAVVGGAE